MKKLLFILSASVLSFSLISCTGYGKKVKHGHVEAFYKDGITEAQAQRTADVMYNLDVMVNNPKNDKSFQLTKQNDTVHFRMVVNEEKAAKTTEVNDYNYLAIGDYVSDSVFNGAPVNLDLTNNKFELIRTLPFKKLSPEDYNKAK